MSFSPSLGKNPFCSTLCGQGDFTVSAFLRDALVFQPILQILMLWGSFWTGDVTDDTPAKPCWEPAGFAASRSETGSFGPGPALQRGWTELLSPCLQLLCPSSITL